MSGLAKFSLSAVVGILLAGSCVVSAHGMDEHEHFGHPGRMVDGHGQVLDNRYNHGHYYPAFGASVHVLPDGYRPYFYGGRSFYFSGGVWYAPSGPGFIVVRPPVGVVINVLPPYYSTVWFAGIPYYYANDVYYTWNPAQNGYVVVDPPANADQPATPPTADPGDLIVYPKNGQTTAQQSADRYECHNWARSQTGFDPTQTGGGVPGDAGSARSAYNRAMAACLTGRGYEVK